MVVRTAPEDQQLYPDDGRRWARVRRLYGPQEPPPLPPLVPRPEPDEEHGDA